MFKYIYELIFPNQEKKIASEIKKKYEQAINFQRNGNIKAYSILMNEISNLEDKLARLKNDSGD
jgi:cell fate (sporulation/competence/biofilm development) regulator YmcA (YheA/YmcA/DUF963 family)